MRSSSKKPTSARCRLTKQNNTERCTKIANKRYSEIEDYGKGFSGENGHNVKYMNSSYY